MAVQHEIVISLWYRYDPNDPCNITDSRDGKKLGVSDFDTKLLVYEDRVVGWFFQPADDLVQRGNAGYPVLQIAVSQIEGIEQYRRGVRSKGRSEEFFKHAVASVFPAAAGSQSLLGDFWTDVRCGLFHNGFASRSVLISEGFPDALAKERTWLKVNPILVLNAVRADFNAYVRDLKNPANTELRAKFKKLWDEAWRDAKDKLGAGLSP